MNRVLVIALVVVIVALVSTAADRGLVQAETVVGGRSRPSDRDRRRCACCRVDDRSR